MSGMVLAPLNMPDLVYVADNMREWDRREIFACRWSENPAEFARDILALPGFGWVTGRDGKAIAAIGATEYAPGVWSVWMFATDDFKSIRIGMTKLAKRVIIPTMRNLGMRRAECRSMDGHTDAQLWLEALGARREATHKSLGKGGEDFHCYALMAET